jgi:FdhD protein
MCGSCFDIVLINNFYKKVGEHLKRDYSYVKINGININSSMDCIVEEVPLSIFINGRHFVTAMTSPSMVKEFILGYLFSERIINGLHDIESMDIDGNVARLIIKNPIKAIVPRKPIVSGCGGLSTFLDESKIPTIISDMKVDTSSIYKAMSAMFESDLHSSTGGVHSVGLFDESGKVIICEDIGRHNALDKAIGFGLSMGVDFGQTFAASTGRISSEMALKCSVSGIPLIVSRGATTSLALDIADRSRLTIVGFVRANRMNVYTNCWRISEVSIDQRI